MNLLSKYNTTKFNYKQLLYRIYVKEINTNVLFVPSLVITIFTAFQNTTGHKKENKSKCWILFSLVLVYPNIFNAAPQTEQSSRRNTRTPSDASLLQSGGDRHASPQSFKFISSSFHSSSQSRNLLRVWFQHWTEEQRRTSSLRMRRLSFGFFFFFLGWDWRAIKSLSWSTGSLVSERLTNII